MKNIFTVFIAAAIISCGTSEADKREKYIAEKDATVAKIDSLEKILKQNSPLITILLSYLTTSGR